MTPTATKAGTGEEQSPRNLQGCSSADSFISNFSPPELGENKFYVLSHLDCGHLLQQPEETNTGPRVGTEEGAGQGFPLPVTAGPLRLLKPSTFYPAGGP